MRYKHGDKIHNAKFLGYENAAGFTYGRPYTLVVHSTKSTGEPKQVSVISDNGMPVILFANSFSWKATEDRPSVEDLLEEGRKNRQKKMDEKLYVFIRNRFLSGKMHYHITFSTDELEESCLDLAFDRACAKLNGLDDYKLDDVTYQFNRVAEVKHFRLKKINDK